MIIFQIFLIQIFIMFIIFHIQLAFRQQLHASDPMRPKLTIRAAKGCRCSRCFCNNYSLPHHSTLKIIRHEKEESKQTKFASSFGQ